MKKDYPIEEEEQLIQSTKVVSSQNLIIYLLFLGWGLVMGITLSSYLKEIPHVVEKEVIKSESGPLGLSEYLNPPAECMHDMTDPELLWRASFKPKVVEYPFKRILKVAFMFLAKRDLPMAPLWQIFRFPEQGGEVGGIQYGGSRAPPIGKRSPRLVQPEVRPAVRGLSSTSQPSTIISSAPRPLSLSRTISTARLAEAVTTAAWRKDSQWFEMSRELALEVVSDSLYLSLFRDWCKPACYSDEHYLPTFVTKERERQPDADVGRLVPRWAPPDQVCWNRHLTRDARPAQDGERVRVQWEAHESLLLVCQEVYC
ncbi:Core-2/I-branching beta-1,6-N-acetylglucosaminyltransferase family protein,6-N-acetylglucosaminyltransferase family protein [Striga asiatica]|uniref:Core-2/I-branching beta-1,6-N-acetylglucosaminyltransferase family protein,6-N-acetylglucosaminyltransferase family protein n=1 Tax=Striga asiatica TaxID=4170 RepID=A0A5A7PIE2_STRAF|nr:Core-2/I-branching beta-1,6-N-acetylglucosaminyltransferase family protein,6-N-acetylglucosaminyltransferase family protein [Striga asiatica]